MHGDNIPATMHRCRPLPWLSDLMRRWLFWRTARFHPPPTTKLLPLLLPVLSGYFCRTFTRGFHDSGWCARALCRPTSKHTTSPNQAGSLWRSICTLKCARLGFSANQKAKLRHVGPHSCWTVKDVQKQSETTTAGNVGLVGARCCFLCTQMSSLCGFQAVKHPAECLLMTTWTELLQKA